jgi:hypothetical protein
VAGDDQTGITIGASGADFAFFDDRYVFSQPIEVKGTTNTDGTATDDQGFRFKRHI